MTDQPLVSIIVPVYNVEPYLRQCLDSILSQTYTNWEAILVDDGSKDKSGEICDEYANKDSRVRVVHKENGGVSSARNLGIEKASGDWFLFCDSDDMLYEEAIRTFVSRIKDGIDSVCGGYVEIDDKEGSIINLSTTRDYEIEIDRIETLKDFYKKQYGDLFNGYLWNRLLKADIIRQNQLRFREDIYIKEDGLFLVQFLCKSTGLHSYTSKPVYKYRRNGDGTMSTYSKSFNEKTCSNLIARCCCYEAIKSVTDEKSLLALAKDRISSMYKALILFFVRDKNKDVLKVFRISLMTFKYVSPLYIMRNYIKR